MIAGYIDNQLTRMGSIPAHVTIDGDIDTMLADTQALFSTVYHHLAYEYGKETARQYLTMLKDKVLPEYLARMIETKGWY